MLMGSSTIKNIITKLDEDTEFINKDRFSKLTYVGHKKISRINRKTAIIAFSTEEVYAIAGLSEDKREVLLLLWVLLVLKLEMHK